MLKQFLFYLHYAFRNVWRNRQWSAFAVISVATGVATVVALRSLGLAIDDSLTSNIRQSNHGDISLEIGPIFFDVRTNDDDQVFNERYLSALEGWAREHDAQLSGYIAKNLQIVAEEGNAGPIQFATSLFVDLQTYPPTGPILALDPLDVPLVELFQGGNEIVVSRNLADLQGLAVGDTVRVSGSPESFVVRGIVPTEAEAGLRDPFASLFGFAYFDRDIAESLSVIPLPNRISIVLPDGTSFEEMEAQGNTLNSFQYLLNLRRGDRDSVRIFTVPSILEQNETVADYVGRFIVIMGLGAMLLGGVGIINTMLVMVRRRTTEIAALKTFGLKGRQIAMLFMSEGLILGLIGCVVGALVGLGLSVFTNAYGEAFIQQPLSWRVYPEALLFGFGLGIVVTAVFSVFPVLTAVRVRPNIILRPNETHIPRVGILHSLLSLIFVVISLGLITGQIIGPFPENNIPRLGEIKLTHVEIGLISVTITLAILGLLVGLFWILVWLVGKLPTFGYVELQLALRNMTTRRVRTATTLLALSAGMFALSSITFFGAGVREILQFSLTGALGGNVVIVPLLPDELASIVIDEQLGRLEGITYSTRILLYDGRILRVDGQSDQQGWTDISVQDSDNPNLFSGNAVVGRVLRLSDRGQSVAVIKNTPELRELGITVGSMITLSVDGRQTEFEVVGIISADSTPEGAILGEIQVPPETLGNARPQNQLNTFLVDEAHLNDVMLTINSIPLLIPIDVGTVDNLFSRFIDQFSALPLLVGILSTGAAAVIMANTVALSTLERRRQIGILKAVGLKGRRVLRIMLLESLVVSLLGGIIGIGLSAIGVAIMTYVGLGDVVFIPDEASPIAVLLIIVAVIIAGLATFLSANVAVRERVLNVLRYE